MAPVVTLGGRMVVDVEGEGERADQSIVQLIEQAVNKERRRAREVDTSRVETSTPGPSPQPSNVTKGESWHRLTAENEALKKKIDQADEQRRQEAQMLKWATERGRREDAKSARRQQERPQWESSEGEEEDDVVMQQRKMLECANQDSRKKCRQGERETRRKYNLRSGQGQMTQAEVQKNELMCPLVTTSGGQHYEPMVLRDVTAMMEKMPPLHRGGKVWLNKFLALMSGQSCTLGDMRQMLAGACSLVQLQAIEEAAGTARLGREVPLPQVAAPLFENIKLTFPQPTDLAPIMFLYDVKMSPAQHYVTCVESWIETTGRHPALTHEAEVLFRTALLDGLPPDVKKQLMSDPDILVCAEERFKRHLLHHCRMFTESQAKVENETDALSKQLLKLQLAKMHGEAKQSKSQKKEMQMSQAPQVVGRGRG
nr:uncharacterized protein LOC125972254 [Syngnathus scovelli]